LHHECYFEFFTVRACARARAFALRSVPTEKERWFSTSPLNRSADEVLRNLQAGSVFRATTVGNPAKIPHREIYIVLSNVVN